MNVILSHTPAIVELLLKVGLSFLPLMFFKEILNRRNLIILMVGCVFLNSHFFKTKKTKKT